MMTILSLSSRTKDVWGKWKEGRGRRAENRLGHGVSEEKHKVRRMWGPGVVGRQRRRKGRKEGARKVDDGPISRGRLCIVTK